MDNLNGTVDILWRGKYLVLVGLVCGLIGATLATQLSTKVYQATGVIQVESGLSSGGTEVLGLQQASQGLAATYARLITAPSFLARIRPQVAGGRYTTSDLVTGVSASSVTQNTQSTNLIQLSAQAGSAAAATALANGVARAFVNTIEKDSARRATQQHSQLQVQITALTKQIETLNSGGGSLSTAQAEQIRSLRAARSALTTEMASVIAQAAGQEGSVNVVAPATASSAPIKPRPLLNALVGIALGLLAGIGFAWLRSVLDRELHSSTEVQPLIEVPVLASIPLRRGADTDDLVTREAYDVLRTNLTFLSLERPLAVLTVTSYEAGEGKTAAAEGLALAAARRDLKVLLIDGDLRTGALSARLGASGRPGLTNLMILAREFDQETDLIRDVGHSLSLLPAGPVPPNPPSVLANPRMARLVLQLRDKYDLIVIDSPPVGHLADAAILAAVSDASLVVARTGKTQKADLVAAAAALKRTPTPLVGAVIFEPRSLDSTYYPSSGGVRTPDRPAQPLPSEGRKGVPDHAPTIARTRPQTRQPPQRQRRS
jgi:succinoglycan biosynthesis transport protein ExoP